MLLQRNKVYTHSSTCLKYTFTYVLCLSNSVLFALFLHTIRKISGFLVNIKSALLFLNQDVSYKTCSQFLQYEVTIQHTVLRAMEAKTQTLVVMGLEGEALYQNLELYKCLWVGLCNHFRGLQSLQAQVHSQTLFSQTSWCLRVT